MAKDVAHKQGVTTMADDEVIANQQTILSNQQRILANQEHIEANQAKLKEGKPRIGQSIGVQAVSSRASLQRSGHEDQYVKNLDPTLLRRTTGCA